jgi:hypothetical protein
LAPAWSPPEFSRSVTAAVASSAAAVPPELSGPQGCRDHAASCGASGPPPGAAADCAAADHAAAARPGGSPRRPRGQGRYPRPRRRRPRPGSDRRWTYPRTRRMDVRRPDHCPTRSPAASFGAETPRASQSVVDTSQSPPRGGDPAGLRSRGRSGRLERAERTSSPTWRVQPLEAPSAGRRQPRSTGGAAELGREPTAERDDDDDQSLPPDRPPTSPELANSDAGGKRGNPKPEAQRNLTGPGELEGGSGAHARHRDRYGRAGCRHVKPLGNVGLR